MKENSKFSSFFKNKTNHPKNEFLSYNHKKKIMIKPPFKKGLYSYKQTFHSYQNINNNNFFSYVPQNYSVIQIKKDKNHILNIPPIDLGNPSLSFSSINLNKYKINIVPSDNKNGKSENQQINNDSSLFIKNPNLSVNLNNTKNNINNLLNNSGINLEYYNYFNDSRLYEKESRRMIIELLKIKLRENNNGKNKSIKQVLKENKISLKVLNKKMTKNENEYETNNNLNSNNNKEVFGEAKKTVYLKNLEYYQSQNSTITTEVISPNNNKIFNIENNYLNNKNKKRINIINFLVTPRVLNLIEDTGEKQKFVFLISLEEIFHLEGKESYIFQWKSMETNEVENEFNLKLIKKCEGNKLFKNRFSIKVENEDIGEFIFYEIETPSEEISNNYVIGINYLVYK